MRALLSFILLVVVLASATNRRMLPNRPNIVMILADDMGYQDAGFKGSDILTPILDGLASTGVILENHYVMPQCSPTRASLMTGRHAIRTGFWHGNIKPGEEWGLPLNESTMAEMLKRNGYVTHAIGKWHCGMHTRKHTPIMRGFDTFYGMYLGAQDYFSHKRMASLDFRIDYRDEKGEFVDHMRDELFGSYNTDIFTRRAISTISTHDPSKPLFLYLSYTAPHGPIQASRGDLKKYSTHMTGSSKKRKTYATMISVMDRGVGEVASALKQYRLLDNTLIVFSSDNGAVVGGSGSNYPLRGGKRSLHEGGIRGLSFVNSPLLQTTGYVNKNIHHVTDWYVTFQALARDLPEQAKNPQLELDGFNIWKSISQNKSSGRDEVLINMKISDKIANSSAMSSDNNFNKSYFLDETRELKDEEDNLFVIRCGKWKLFEGNMIQSTWSYENAGKKQKRNGEREAGIRLYDLLSDPREMHNVAAKFPDIVRKILKKKPEYAGKMTRIGKRRTSYAGKTVTGWYPWVPN